MLAKLANGCLFRAAASPAAFRQPHYIHHFGRIPMIAIAFATSRQPKPLGFICREQWKQRGGCLFRAAASPVLWVRSSMNARIILSKWGSLCMLRVSWIVVSSGLHFTSSRQDALTAMWGDGRGMPSCAIEFVKASHHAQ